MEQAVVPLNMIPKDLDGRVVLSLMENDFYRQEPCINFTYEEDDRPKFVVSQYHGDKTAMS